MRLRTAENRLSGNGKFDELVHASRVAAASAATFENRLFTTWAFRAIDLTSAIAGLAAATDSGVAHFVYLSVSQFANGVAPAMRANVAAIGHVTPTRMVAALVYAIENPRHRLKSSTSRAVERLEHRWNVRLRMMSVKVPALQPKFDRHA